MPTSLLHFDISINRLYPGQKLDPRGQDRRWGRFNGGFKPEVHTGESLLAEIRAGHSFCCVLRDDDCGRDHCGVERRCCYPMRKDDPTHCGRPLGYRKASHFLSAQTLELDFDQGDENSSISFLMADPFIAQCAAVIYSTLSSTPGAPKSRVVFILEESITDSARYRKGREALLHRYPQSDQSIKDISRFLYGSHPHTGEAVLL